MKLLLLSNSTNHDSGYLDHAVEQIAGLFGGVRRILFVPFALHDQAWYWTRARERFSKLEIEVDRLEEGPSARAAVRNAAGIFIGGGNTFRLLDRLHRCDVVGAIRERAAAGMPYMGASAGTVVASPTLKTTNDMPIVQPPSFHALGLVPFQINCHYLDPEPGSRHMGETREQRIVEFLEESDVPVVGLREGAMLQVEGHAVLSVELSGTSGARIFRRGTDPVEESPGSRLDYLAVSPGSRSTR